MEDVADVAGEGERGRLDLKRKAVGLRGGEWDLGGGEGGAECDIVGKCRGEGETDELGQKLFDTGTIAVASCNYAAQNGQGATHVKTANHGCGFEPQNTYLLCFASAATRRKEAFSNFPIPTRIYLHNMPALGYGLNVIKKPSSIANRPAPAKRKTIFDDDSGAEDGPEEIAAEAITTIGGLEPSTTSSKTPTALQRPPKESSTKVPAKKAPPKISQYGDLSTDHTTSLHASTAQSLDSSIYDYDSVYDSLHAKSHKTHAEDDKRPKYMGNLLAAAEIRKRDQLRAKEKMLAREREAEGDEFADKEKFVTEAYKAQQEEVRRLEEEEIRRETDEMEKRRKAGGGMAGLYRGLLDRDEKRHEEIVKAAEESKGQTTTDAEKSEAKNDKSEIQLAREKGAIINDDGVIVDKRQLLNAGLNIAAKPKPASTPRDGDAARNAALSSGLLGLQGRGAAKQAMRERQTRMLEAQLEEASKRAAEDEDVQREALERAAKSRKTEGDISSARERYLQRKREQAEAVAAAGKGD